MEVFQKKPFVVSVEGNIGSGKSTMLQYYSELDDVQLHPEPVEKWQNLNGHNLLEKLYADPKRWSFQVRAKSRRSFLNDVTQLFRQLYIISPFIDHVVHKFFIPLPQVRDVINCSCL
jgi:deoxyadenosine/deoxycytidine kinase